MQMIISQLFVAVFTVVMVVFPFSANAETVRTCDQYSIKALNKKAEKYQGEIKRAAKKHKVDPELIKAVITAESCFRPSVYSCKDAGGLMQLIPSTAASFGAFDVFDPAENIDAGARYLRYLLKRYNGSVIHAIAAYNAGEGRVDKGQEEITVPFRETRRYVGQVLAAYTKFSTEAEEPRLLLAKWQEADAAWQAGGERVDTTQQARGKQDEQPSVILAVYSGEQSPVVQQASLKQQVVAEAENGQETAVENRVSPVLVKPNIQWTGAAAARIRAAEQAASK